MEVVVVFKVNNPSFDQEYADTYNHGEESVDNWKVLWMKAWKIDKDVAEISLKSNSTLVVGENQASYSFPDMEILECRFDDGGSIQAAVTNKLVLRTHQVENKKYNKTRFYFYLSEKFLSESDDYISLDLLIVARADMQSSNPLN